MVGKAPVWSHFGLWDFGRAYAVQTHDTTNPDTTIQRYAENIDISAEEARQYFLEVSELSSEQQRNTWISPYPQYVTNQMRSCEETNTSIRCELDLNLQQQRGGRVVLETLIVPLDNRSDAEFVLGVYGQNDFRQQEQRIRPASLSVGENGEISSQTFSDAGVQFGVLLHDNDGQWEVLLGSPDILPSMFTRLYFLDGSYAENFEKMTDRQSTVSGARIKAWTYSE